MPAQADNAAVGGELARSQALDCITTDLLMPGMAGGDFMESLRAEGIETPVVVVTADIQKTTREDCLRRGAFAVLEKPVDGDELRRAVEAAISEGARQRRAELSPEQAAQEVLLHLEHEGYVGPNGSR